MNMKSLMLASALVLVTGLSQAADNDPAVIQKLNAMLGNAETITARFSQLTLDSSGTQLQETKGEMAVKRPGLLRWHTDPPQEQLVVSDGKKVWLYDPDLEQVSIKKLDQRVSHTPALLLSGDAAKIAESFNVTYQASANVTDFFLKPRDKDTLFDTLRISFKGKTLNDMQLVDSVGQKTNILFMGVKTNEPVQANQFTFEVPAGADVIEE